MDCGDKIACYNRVYTRNREEGLAVDNVLDDVACYCVQFRRAARAVSELYAQALCPSGVTPCQLTILNTVSELQPCTTSAIAKHIGLDRTTLVRSLKPLIEKGLVKDMSQKGARDRRLCMSPEGDRVLVDALPRWNAAQALMEERIGVDILAAVRGIPGSLAEQPVERSGMLDEEAR